MAHRRIARIAAPAWAAILLAGLALIFIAAGQARADKLTLDDSIKIALESNPSVQMAQESLRKADAMIAEVKSQGMPKLSLDGTYQRVDKVPAATFGDSSIELGTLDSRSADLTLTQPIDVFGLVKTGKKAASTGKSGYQHGLDGQVNNTSLDTKIAFYGVLRAQKYLKVQEDTIALLEAHLKDTQLKYEAGTLAKFDVLRAETQVANARQDLIASQNGVELAKAAFNNVLGRPLDAPVELIEPDMPEFANAEMAACTDSACKFRPEVLQADSAVDLSDKMVKVAHLSGKPTFALRWAYNRNLDATMFSPRESSWRAFLVTSIPVFDGGQSRAKVDQATCDANTARLACEQAKDGATLDAKQSYLSMKEGEERIRAAEKGLEQARESMRLAQLRYRGGVSTQIEVLDAQTALTLAETNYVNAQYDYQVALAKLERAVGGKQQFARLTGAGSQTAEAGTP